MGYLVKVGDDRTPTRVTITDPSGLLSASHYTSLIGVDGIVRVGDDVLCVTQAKQVVLLQSTDNFVSAEVKKIVSTD